MKRVILAVLVLAVTTSAWAGNVPSGVTGFWQFATPETKYAATFGSPLTSTIDNTWMFGPYTEIGTDANHGAYWDQGIIGTWPGANNTQFITATHGIAPNGGGTKVNQYSVMMDIKPGTQTWVSLFQTDTTNSTDGDLFIYNYPNGGPCEIGIGSYSTNTFAPDTWHRIVWTVETGNLTSGLCAYVDGVPYLQISGGNVDTSRFALDPTMLLLTDNDGEIGWGLLNTVAVWDHPLTANEVAGMGGWLNGSAVPTPLYVPEPSAFILLAAGLAMFIAIRKRK